MITRRNIHRMWLKIMAMAMVFIFCINSFVLALPDTLAPQPGNPDVYEELWIGMNILHQKPIDDFIMAFLDKAVDLSDINALKPVFDKCASDSGINLKDIISRLDEVGVEIKVIVLSSDLLRERQMDIPEFNRKRVMGHADKKYITVFAYENELEEGNEAGLREVAGRIFHEIRARSTMLDQLVNDALNMHVTFTSDNKIMLSEKVGLAQRVGDDFEKANIQTQAEITQYGHIKDYRLIKEFEKLIFSREFGPLHRDFSAGVSGEAAKEQIEAIVSSICGKFKLSTTTNYIIERNDGGISAGVNIMDPEDSETIPWRIVLTYFEDGRVTLKLVKYPDSPAVRDVNKGEMKTTLTELKDHKWLLEEFLNDSRNGAEFIKLIEKEYRSNQSVQMSRPAEPASKGPIENGSKSNQNMSVRQSIEAAMKIFIGDKGTQFFQLNEPVYDVAGDRISAKLVIRSIETSRDFTFEIIDLGHHMIRVRLFEERIAFFSGKIERRDVYSTVVNDYNKLPDYVRWALVEWKRKYKVDFEAAEKRRMEEAVDELAVRPSVIDTENWSSAANKGPSADSGNIIDRLRLTMDIVIEDTGIRLFRCDRSFYDHNAATNSAVGSVKVYGITEEKDDYLEFRIEVRSLKDIKITASERSSSGSSKCAIYDVTINDISYLHSAFMGALSACTDKYKDNITQAKRDYMKATRENIATMIKEDGDIGSLNPQYDMNMEPGIFTGITIPAPVGSSDMDVYFQIRDRGSYDKPYFTLECLEFVEIVDVRSIKDKDIDKGVNEFLVNVKKRSPLKEWIAQKRAEREAAGGSTGVRLSSPLAVGAGLPDKLDVDALQASLPNMAPNEPTIAQKPGVTGNIINWQEVKLAEEEITFAVDAICRRWGILNPKRPDSITHDDNGVIIAFIDMEDRDAPKTILWRIMIRRNGDGSIDLQAIKFPTPGKPEFLPLTNTSAAYLNGDPLDELYSICESDGDFKGLLKAANIAAAAAQPDAIDADAAAKVIDQREIARKKYVRGELEGAVRVLYEAWGLHDPAPGAIEFAEDGAAKVSFDIKDPDSVDSVPWRVEISCNPSMGISLDLINGLDKNKERPACPPEDITILYIILKRFIAECSLNKDFMEDVKKAAAINKERGRPAGGATFGEGEPSRGSVDGTIDVEVHEWLRKWLEENKARSPKNAMPKEIEDLLSLRAYSVPGMYEATKKKFGEKRAVKGHYAIRSGVIYVDRDFLPQDVGITTLEELEEKLPYLAHEAFELIGIIKNGLRNFGAKNVRECAKGKLNTLQERVGWFKTPITTATRREVKESIKRLVRWLDKDGSTQKVFHVLSRDHNMAPKTPDSLNERVPRHLPAGFDSRGVRYARPIRVVRGAAGVGKEGARSDISHLGLSGKTEGYLRREGITSIADLATYNERALKRIKGIGGIRYSKIEEALAGHGFRSAEIREIRLRLSGTDSINKLQLSADSRVDTLYLNALHNAGIDTIAQMTALSERELGNIRRIGRGGCVEIKEALARHGFRLADIAEIREKLADADPIKKLLSPSDNLPNPKYLNALNHAGITDIGKLTSLSEEELKKIKWIGEIGCAEIKAALARHGLELAEINEIRESDPINRLTLSARFINALRRAGIYTIGQLMALDGERIKSMRHIGDSGYVKIKAALARHGFSRVDTTAKLNNMARQLMRERAPALIVYNSGITMEAIIKAVATCDDGDSLVIETSDGHPRVLLRDIKSIKRLKDKGSIANCIRELHRQASPISIGELILKRGYEETAVRTELSMLDGLSLLDITGKGVAGDPYRYSLSPILRGLTDDQIDAVCEISIEINRKPVKILDRYEISPDMLEQVKTRVIEEIQGIIHAENRHTPRIPPGKVLWHVVSNELIPEKQQINGFIEQLNRGFEHKKGSERMLILRSGQTIGEAVAEIKRKTKAQDCIIHAILDDAGKIDDYKSILERSKVGTIKMAVIAGELGNYFQLEGAMAISRALTIENITERNERLLRLHKILTGKAYEGANLPDDPIALAKTIIFELPKIEVYDIDLGRLSKRLIDNILSAA